MFARPHRAAISTSAPAVLRRLLVLLVAAALGLTGLLTGQSVSQAAPGDFLSRHGGSDRYAVAASVSASQFGPGVPVVYIAAGMGYGDALVAGPVAAAKGGPILLVRPTAVPQATAAELTRLRPGRIVVLGGTASVPAAVLAALSGYTSGGVTRVEGADRYDLATNLSAASFAPGVPTVYVASGEGLADALAGAPAAARERSPLLLAPPSSTGTLPTSTVRELARLRPGRIVVLGGAASVSAATATTLRQYATSGQVHRMEGADRYAVAVATSRFAYPNGAGTVYVGNGAALADALAGAPVAGLRSAPMLLVRTGASIDASVTAEIRRLAPTRIVILGGEGSVSAAQAAALAAHGPAAPVVPAPAPAGALPVDVPVAGAGGARVFAHYFPPYPVSFENGAPGSDYYARNYLNPAGESGIHAAYGGLLRDRPLGRAPLGTNWRAADMTTEVDQAARAGLDGFFVDILTLDGANWDRTVELMRAAGASSHNFVVAPQVDTTASAGRATAVTLASRMAQLAALPGAYRLGTGEFVLSAFKAEGLPVSYWREVIRLLEDVHGVPTVFMPVFLEINRMAEYAPISYAAGNWGVRNPGMAVNSPNYAAQAHALGLKFIAPVAVQDVRPNQRAYWEAANLQTLRATWSRAISDGADFVVMNTWNDYSESTSFAPSMAHGHAFLDVNAYYLTQFETRAAPRIVRDALYVTHRTQAHATAPTLRHETMRLLNGDWTPARDQVEVQTFLTAPAAVTVRIGTATHTYTAPAGVHAEAFGLRTGQVHVSATRNGVSVGIAASPHTVTATPDNQDLQYYATGSRR